jgi:hypothetical protein
MGDRRDVPSSTLVASDGQSPLRTFIDRVIVPALVERFLREQADRDRAKGRQGCIVRTNQ